MTMTRFLCILLLALCARAPAWAGPGHDHDHDHDGPAPAAGPGLPRFAAASELFELVGVLDGLRLTLYLDAAATNEPLREAEIELEIGALKLKAQPQEDGSFQATLAQPLPAGVLPVTATVTTAGEADLLAGELDLSPDAARGAHEEPAHGHGLRWTLVGLGLAAILGGGWWLRRGSRA